MPFMRMTRTRVKASSSSLLISFPTNSRQVKRCLSSAVPRSLNNARIMGISMISEAIADADEDLFLFLLRALATTIREIELEPTHVSESLLFHHAHLDAYAQVGVVVRCTEGQDVGCVVGLPGDREAPAWIDEEADLGAD